MPFGHLPYAKPHGDELDAWADADARHAQHRGQVRNLLIALAFVTVISTFVSAQAWGFAIFIVPWLALELWMVRRSGQTKRVPDHRPADPVEIELDDT